MLLCGVIDELIAMGHKSTFFFFCQASDARLNTAASVLRGLLFLMLDQNPALSGQLRDEYDRAGVGKQVFEDANGWDVLRRMLLSAISHNDMQDIVLVIDALDECTSGLNELISFIIDLTTHVQVIVSSRPELEIDRGLAVALEDTKVYLSLDLNQDVISAAVSSYIRHKVHQLAVSKGYDEEMRVFVQSYLADNANDTFLWVALVCEQLADNRVGTRHSRRMLQEFPPGLNSLYNRILSNILGLRDAEHCRQVLSIMSIVTRPLNLVELASILDHAKYLEDVVAECGSLLTIREGVVYFIHQSAKDFLARQAKRIMPLGVGLTHNLVLKKLLQAMGSTLRRNIYNIDTNGVPIDEICVPEPDPLVSARYACVYWVDHLMQASDREELLGEVRSFITKHFLHWLEALSLLRSISKGILSVSRIQRLIEVCLSPRQGAMFSFY